MAALLAKRGTTKRTPQLRQLVLALAGSMVCASAVIHAEGGGQAGATRIPLLGGRLSALFPANAVPTPRVPATASPAEPVEVDSRVTTDVGKARLVVLCDELLYESGPDFPGATRDYARSLSPEFGSLRIAPAAIHAANLRGYWLVPARPHGGGNTYFMRAALIRNSDGLLERLSFYANAQGLKAIPALARVWSRVVGSLTSGGKPVGGEARAALVGGQSLSVNVPSGYACAVRRGPDFDVYYVERIVPLETPRGSLGIYVGGAPSRFGRSGATTAGKLLGRRVQWRRWNTAPPPSYHLETIVDRPGRGAGSIHVFIAAQSEGEMAALRRIADTLRSVRQGPQRRRE